MIGRLLAIRTAGASGVDRFGGVEMGSGSDGKSAEPAPEKPAKRGGDAGEAGRVMGVRRLLLDGPERHRRLGASWSPATGTETERRGAAFACDRLGEHPPPALEAKVADRRCRGSRLER
jgi:hypothetical protein